MTAQMTPVHFTNTGRLAEVSHGTSRVGIRLVDLLGGGDMSVSMTPAEAAALGRVLIEHADTLDPQPPEEE